MGGGEGEGTGPHFKSLALSVWLRMYPLRALGYPRINDIFTPLHAHGWVILGEGGSSYVAGFIYLLGIPSQLLAKRFAVWESMEDTPITSRPALQPASMDMGLSVCLTGVYFFLAVMEVTRPAAQMTEEGPLHRWSWPEANFSPGDVKCLQDPSPSPALAL